MNLQLLNRLNPDAFDQPDELNAIEVPGKVKEGVEDYRDIKLHRMQSVKASVKMGFTAKDEQKLIQFASHLAVRAAVFIAPSHQSSLSTNTSSGVAVHSRDAAEARRRQQHHARTNPGAAG